MFKKDQTERILVRHLAFLEATGFRSVQGEFQKIRAVAYVSALVEVVGAWDWKEEVASLAIVRRRAADPRDEPY